MMESMRRQGALVECYVREGTGTANLDLQRKDWAISVYFNENNMFSVNPEGVGKFDTTNTRGSDVGDSNNWTTTAWSNEYVASPRNIGAIEACSLQGKRLPSASQLAALERAWYNEHGTRPVAGGTPSAFTASNYWSSSSAAGYSPARAWRVSFNSASVSTSEATYPRYVRCVS